MLDLQCPAVFVTPRAVHVAARILAADLAVGLAVVRPADRRRQAAPGR